MYDRPKITTYRPGDVRKYAHLKRDGIMITVIAEGAVKCLTRHPDGAHQVDLDMDPINLLRESMWRGALFCELYAPGEEASQVKSHLANGALHRLKIECFAVPSQSANISLEALRDFCSVLKFPFTNFVKLEPIVEGMTSAIAISNWLDVKPDDTEGLVFKDGNLKNWCKWKPVLTTDLVIIGYKEGKGKYLGTLGALELGLADGAHVCNCSGMDDATRDLISEDEDKYLGTVVEVEYQRRDSGGGLRHPRFKRFREDKGAHECTTI